MNFDLNIMNVSVNLNIFIIRIIRNDKYELVEIIM